MTDTRKPNPADRPFVVRRVFNAPRELVFNAFTEIEHLVKWWGPVGFIMVSATIDASPGGTFLYCMKAPGGPEMCGKWVFREIASPEQLVFVSSLCDAEGNVARHPMAANWPLETLSTLSFVESHGKTTLTMEGIPIGATEAERHVFAAGHESMQQGFAGTLKQLEDYLATL